MTISKAYSLLEMEGLLERRRGVGLFVVALRQDKVGQTRIDLLEEVLTKAVVTAIQLEIPEDEARDMLAQLYEKLQFQMRRSSMNDAGPIVEMNKISKWFGSTKALDG